MRHFQQLFIFFAVVFPGMVLGQASIAFTQFDCESAPWYVQTGPTQAKVAFTAIIPEGSGTWQLYSLRNGGTTHFERYISSSTTDTLTIDQPSTGGGNYYTYSLNLQLVQGSWDDAAISGVNSIMINTTLTSYDTLCQTPMVPSTGINDFAVSGKLLVWPNPSTSAFNMELPMVSQYQVMTTLGQIILEGTSSNGTTRFGDDLPPGQYLVVTHDNVTSKVTQITRN